MIIPESSLLRGLLVRSHSIFDGPKHPVLKRSQRNARTSGPSLGGVERTSPNTGWLEIAGGTLKKWVTISFIPGSCLSSIFSPWKTKRVFCSENEGHLGSRCICMYIPRKLAFWTPKTWRWMEDYFHVGVYFFNDKWVTPKYWSMS